MFNGMRRPRPHQEGSLPLGQGQAPDRPSQLSRRAILRTSALGGMAAAALTTADCSRPPESAAPAGAALPRVQPAVAGTRASRTYAFNQGWLFGGSYVSGATARGYDDSGFTPVTLPHTVTPLSWGNWDHSSWEHVWIYRKHFSLVELAGRRAFVDFDGVMVNATVLLNGVKVSSHRGGYLPWSAELTGHLAGADNVLAVIVDSRWLNVPPTGQASGAKSIDYLQPGGIYRDVTLRTVSDVYLADVFARPASVLNASRRVDLQATLDVATMPAGPVRITAELLDSARTIAAAVSTVPITRAGRTVARLSITGIGSVQLWSPDTPKLYTVWVTAANADGQTHTVSVRIGFRQAVFRTDGFYLNGERVKIFGLNRHQLFPYLGMAAPSRLQRRDAEILKSELNCNMVRCSHYPQSPHFLDACDELGIMVWQEPPGWGWVGDAAWQDVLVQNVSDMVVRDRSRPSVIVWGTRVNESRNYPRLYKRTRRLAAELDGSRPTAGAMSKHTTAGWAQDVFSYDDYHASNGNARLLPPLPEVPYLVGEAVGALDGSPTYRWTATSAVLAEQARMHAQVHNIARSDARYAGLLGWAGIDYASLRDGDRVWDTIKTPGVVDIFRVPKPGAAFYRSQVSPHVRAVVVPVFYWDFGPGSPPHGPGKDAMIATNCERLEIYVGDQHFATGMPDAQAYGHLAYPPVFVDLSIDGSALPELRIDGYVAGRRVASVHMSADKSRDRLVLTADDSSIHGDGTDATRVTFRALDAYRNQRPHVTGDVSLSLAGPAVLIGQNPFAFGKYGGVGGAFVRSLPRRSGQVTVSASHHALGRSTVTLTITPPAPGTQFR
jgi:beta-galactosidase